MSNSNDFFLAAFNELAPDAENLVPHFVTLYSVDSCYGGPEEGGWYYDWWTPIKSIRCETEEDAVNLRDAMRKLADEMSKEARDNWSDSMRSSCDWAEARGLDPADLPEPDGPTDYRIVVEESRGEMTSDERPHYC